jgi:hypothetical protein
VKTENVGGVGKTRDGAADTLSGVPLGEVICKGFTVSGF